MKRYNITINGESPLLLHQDNLVWAEAMAKWKEDPENKKKSVAGDDRTPAWRWLGCLYVEQNKLVMPSDNLMTMFREGGKKVPTGKGQQTFKVLTQSGIMVDQIGWNILVDDKPISYDPIKKLIGNEDFDQHLAVVHDLGFELLVKRAKVQTSKHVRVRPRFDAWTLKGSVTVLEDMITKPILESILQQGGTYCGLGDWRPSSPMSPGPYGRFSAIVEEK